MDTSLTDARIRECTTAGLWRNESLDTYLDRWATTRPDKVALADGQGRYSWAALAKDEAGFGWLDHCHLGHDQGHPARGRQRGGRRSLTAAG